MRNGYLLGRMPPMAKRRKDPAAVRLGRKGGLSGAGIGGRTRWQGISAEERSRIMRAVRKGKRQT